MDVPAKDVRTGTQDAMTNAKTIRHGRRNMTKQKRLNVLTIKAMTLSVNERNGRYGRTSGTAGNCGATGQDLTDRKSYGLRT